MNDKITLDINDPQPSSSYIRDTIIWTLKHRRCYFCNLSEDISKKWIETLNSMILIEKMSVREKIENIFNPLQMLLEGVNEKSKFINRWSHIECILDGSLKDIFHNIKGEQLAVFFNTLLKEANTYKSLGIKRLAWNPIDQFALCNDILLIDELNKKAILIELKNNSKYKLQQYLKYHRLAKIFTSKEYGYDVKHLLINTYLDPGIKKIFSKEKIEVLKGRWKEYYQNNNVDFNQFRVHCFSLNDLKVVSNNLNLSLKEEFEFLECHFARKYNPKV